MLGVLEAQDEWVCGCNDQETTPERLSGDRLRGHLPVKGRNLGCALEDTGEHGRVSAQKYCCWLIFLNGGSGLGMVKWHCLKPSWQAVVFIQ